MVPLGWGEASISPIGPRLRSVVRRSPAGVRTASGFESDSESCTQVRTMLSRGERGVQHEADSFTARR
jgi:hypothetical protein